MIIMIDFFTSPIGLGHATRDVAVAEQFDDFVGKFVTGDSAAKLISEYGYTVENLYNPPTFDVNDGLLTKSTRWLWKYYQYYKECKKISETIIAKDNPSLVTSDEDFASLAVSQEKNIPSILITDILETRFTSGFASIVEKKMNKSMQKIIQNCDVVILPEHGKDIDNIKKVGPIVRETKKDRESLRDELGFSRKTVLVSIGGTDAGKFLIEESLKAIKKINQDIDIVLVTGPSITQKYDVRNLGFVNNLHEIIFASDVLVSLAGKSTIDEATAYGTPSIFIPIKGHFEQEDNAREVGFGFDDIKRLDVLINQKLEEKRNPIHTDGARKAYEIIQKLLR